MNFSLPKLSAVALLSLAAGFGASLWLNAEPEEPGTYPKSCLLKAQNVPVDKDGVKFLVVVCDPCVEPCWINPTNFYKIYDSKGLYLGDSTLTVVNEKCLPCPSGTYTRGLQPQ